MERRELFSPDRRRQQLQSLWADHPHLAIVESFAVFPIQDEDKVTAVLSLGSTCRLDFTPTFKSLVKGIARSVGFTLRNRELHFDRAELQTNAIETATALNAVEIYSDLIHQMGNALAATPELVETVALAAKSRSTSPADLVTHLGKIEEQHDRVIALINQADGVADTDTSTLERASINEIWREATALVQYRIRKLDVKVTPSGDHRVEVYRIQLRQVFFHLLLNSLETFAVRSHPKVRRIELRIMPPKTASVPLTIRYADNAGGINPSTLHSRGSQKDGGALPSVEEAIFMRGVTSRRKGSGNGLWIVRQILGRHYGSINLVQHRGEGVVFDIKIPVDLRDLISARKVM